MLAGPAASRYRPVVSVDPSVDAAALPFVDEHRVLVKASAVAVWAQLGHAISRPRPRLSGLVALLLGTRPARAAGDPLTSGSTLTGFAVTTAVPAERLVLTGRHRFASYTLIFTLREQDGTTRLTARTHARFPGLRGHAYRALVIGTGAHRIALTRLLRGIRLSTQLLQRSAPR